MDTGEKSTDDMGGNYEEVSVNLSRIISNLKRSKYIFFLAKHCKKLIKIIWKTIGLYTDSTV
jgi:hypothetical protein